MLRANLKENRILNSESNPLIAFEGVSFEAQNKDILQNITFQLEAESVTTLIGPNGAGKSTLVKLATGLLTPTKGAVTRAKNIRIGYMPQKLFVDNSMPIKVSRFLSLADSKKVPRYQAVELLNIGHLTKHQIHDLSGGELQRVLLARAILRQPNLLVLDEPLQGVDITGQAELYRLIASLRNELKCAVLMVSHDLHLVMAQTDSVICVNGHICCHGKPESVTQHPEYLKLFGSQAAQNIAVYSHHHDHHHTMHGDAVQCSPSCEHEHDHD